MQPNEEAEAKWAEKKAVANRMHSDKEGGWNPGDEISLDTLTLHDIVNLDTSKAEDYRDLYVWSAYEWRPAPGKRRVENGARNDPLARRITKETEILCLWLVDCRSENCV